MRLLLTVVALSAVALVLAVVVPHGEGQDAGRTGAVTLVGDSLNVGVEPYLARELRGWSVSGDNVVGRGSDDGIAALERIGAGLAPVVVVSLGTNDPQTDADGFRADVRRVLAIAGPRRCVVWATIWRGGSNDAFNAVLAAEADAQSRLVVVRWHELVGDDPAMLAGDDVHGSERGYAARARAIADAARGCLPEAEAS